MRELHVAEISTLPRSGLRDVAGGIRQGLSGGGAAPAARTADARSVLTLADGTLGKTPEDCGPAGPAWSVRLHARVSILGVDIPYTINATQCKK